MWITKQPFIEELEYLEYYIYGCFIVDDESLTSLYYHQTCYMFPKIQITVRKYLICT